MAARRQALGKASMEAARLHQRMRTPYDQPVDVFLLAQRLGLWLTAQPLDNAFGFYLREGDVAGIVVNSRHPESLQRFTCAHEIGHHVLGHESHADDASTLGKYSEIAQRELEAQVFAASLLMPLPLVRRVLRETWDGQSPLGPADVYLFSRGVGVSYAAAAWQLTQHKLLRASDARRLVKQGAAAAKTELRGMKWVNDARADVWVLDERMHGITVACRVGDELHLRLREDLSTGRVWTIDEPMVSGSLQDPSAMETLSWDGRESLAMRKATSTTIGDGATVPDLDLVYDTHLGADGAASGISGLSPRADDLRLFAAFDEGPTTEDEDGWPALPGPGRRVLVLVARTAGSFRVTLSLRPAWDATGPAMATFNFVVRASERNRLSGVGYAMPQKDLRVERLTAA